MNPPNPLTRWTVYGRRKVGVASDNRVLYAGVHAEGLETYDAAKAFLTMVYTKYGDAVQAVIVQLDNGVDRNGERHVLHRLQNGRAWWE